MTHVSLFVFGCRDPNTTNVYKINPFRHLFYFYIYIHLIYYTVYHTSQSLFLFSPFPLSFIFSLFWNLSHLNPSRSVSTTIILFLNFLHSSFRAPIDPTSSNLMSNKKERSSIKGTLNRTGYLIPECPTQCRCVFEIHVTDLNRDRRELKDGRWHFW